jgi:hypothetical protein
MANLVGLYPTIRCTKGDVPDRVRDELEILCQRVLFNLSIRILTRAAQEGLVQ